MSFSIEELSVLRVVLNSIGAFILAAGLYLFLADVFKLPTIKSSQAINNVVKRQKETTSVLDVWLGNAALWLSKKIKMNEFKRQELETDLRTAQMDITPEMFKANAIVKSGMFVVISLPFYLIMPILGGIITLAAVLMYFINVRSISGRIKAHRRKIENDLPRLVATIEKKLTHERGIVGIIESFIPSAGPELARELEITTADIRSGNEEAAVTRLEARVGSPMMSDVCRGFITMIHGDTAEVYWQSIGQKFADIQRNRLRAEANKIPGKVRKLSMLILFCFMLVFIVVIAVEIIGSMGVFKL